MVINEPVPEESIKQFASQLCLLHKDLIQQMESFWNEMDISPESTQFMLGLLTGYACSYQLASSDSTSLIGPIVAFVADKIRKGGIL